MNAEDRGSANLGVRLIEPTKLTVAQWIDTWQETYLTNVKPRTRVAYASDIRLHIVPALGAVRLDALTTHGIQGFYNSLAKGEKGKKKLSAKTIRTIHGILHHALNQAVANGIIRSNPAAAFRNRNFVSVLRALLSIC